MTISFNQQPRPKRTWYVVLIRYLYSGFNPFNRHEWRGIKPLNTNKISFAYTGTHYDYL